MTTGTFKNEDTWCKILADFRSEIRFSPENILRTVAWKIFYAVLRDPDGDRDVFYLDRDGDGVWNWNYNWLDNQWNVDNPFVGRATLFISLPSFFSGIDFLSYVNFPNHRILRTKTKRRMFKKLSEKYEKLKNGDVKKKFFEQSVQSYFGILKHCKGGKLEKELKQ